MNSKSCEIYGKDTHPLAHYYKRCKKLIYRVDARKKPNKKTRIYALKQAWDGENFRCYYTGVRVVEDNYKDPRYITFDHRIPRNENDVVVTCAVLNDMKSDMSEDEFRTMVIRLADCCKGGVFLQTAMNLKYWKR